MTQSLRLSQSQFSLQLLQFSGAVVTLLGDLAAFSLSYSEGANFERWVALQFDVLLVRLKECLKLHFYKI